MAQELSAAGLQSASSLATAGEPGRFLPVAEGLQQLLPGLRRGSTVAVGPGATSLLLALLAEASAAGSWAAVVGMPDLYGLAAHQAGLALDRLALVPYPGPEWPSVVAALLDGVDLVAVAPPAGVPDRLASRLAARARQRGSVLLPYGCWPGADFVLATESAEWEGISAGYGRLRCREVTVVAQGRRRGGQPRRVRVRLPDQVGRLASGQPDTAPVTALPSRTGASNGSPSSAGSPRPVLALLPGGASGAAVAASPDRTPGPAAGPPGQPQAVQAGAVPGEGRAA
ncbi:hypothetical protein JQS43_08315 [Natronosporangium hydrolyticum]|uniref:Uncharacterized protein n=1 Tax=Natronosporangium hydrolyticum TaxID=2811111 RepID=A0A895YFB9_9ACTN|nr:hypothetical protein [Natronosporangium hydrolyticum]QSB16281.1 hypothetical protein JQS43_08315 [Natronosporangium hydrolyticum]